MSTPSGMTPDRWHQITEIFHAARQRRVEERAAFLDQACASDPSLRHHVKAMISAHGEAGEFGESPLTMPPAVVRQLLPGTMLREFRIESLIGAGGMGEVYRATDTLLGRAVAIKVLPDTLVDDPERMARLDREARVLASINHPHIAAIYALVEGPTRGDGRSPGKALVLELVAGTTLADRLRSGSGRASSARALSTGEALELAQQIGAALEAAHDKGIVHRDLKPANIALTPDGAVKVLDFGLAKPIESSIANESPVSISASSTRDGVIVGTAAYMSPEQVRGAKVDRRTDVWAFGCVLYEMLTGRRAFTGDTVSDTLVAVLAHEPDWNALPPDTPSHVRRLLRRTVERNVALRLRDIGDARLELSEPIDVESVASTPRGVPQRIAFIAVGVLVAVATAMFFLGFRVASSDQASAAAAPVFRQLTFRRGAVSTARFAADGRNFVYSASWDGRPHELFTGSIDGPESRPLTWPGGVLLAISRTNEVAVSLGCNPEPVANADCVVGTLSTAPLAGGAPRELATSITYADWTPDGQLTVTRDLPPPNPTRLELPPGRVVHEAPVIRLPRVNRDGSLIAAITRANPSGQDSLVLITREGQARTLSAGWQGVSGLAWSPGDKEIWLTGTRAQQKALYAIGLEGSERLVLSLPAPVNLYDISTDGAVLLGTEVRSSVIVLNGPDDDVERPYSWFDLGWSVGLSADGRRMLFNERGRAVQGRSTMYLRATDGKSAATRLGEGRALALSPDGSTALALRSIPSGEQLVLLPTGAGDPVPMERGSIERYDPTYAGFFDDSRRVLFYGYQRGEALRAFVQDSPSAVPRAITPDLVYASYGAISPDMQWIAATVLDASQKVRHWLFPVAGGDPRPLPELPFDLPPIQWTPDGSELYARRWTPFEQRLDSEIVLLSLRTRQVRPFRTIRVSDPAGAGVPRSVMITRDGKTYTFNYPQTLQDLYVVTGLR